MSSPPGQLVRIREKCKGELNPEHVREFGGCVGRIEESTLPPDWDLWVDVRWEPSGLRYMYRREQLEDA